MTASAFSNNTELPASPSASQPPHDQYTKRRDELLHQIQEAQHQLEVLARQEGVPESDITSLIHPGVTVAHAGPSRQHITPVSPTPPNPSAPPIGNTRSEGPVPTPPPQLAPSSPPPVHVPSLISIDLANAHLGDLPGLTQQLQEDEDSRMAEAVVAMAQENQRKQQQVMESLSKIRQMVSPLQKISRGANGEGVTSDSEEQETSEIDTLRVAAQQARAQHRARGNTQ
eukprot:TRINITY_DN35565_c0_g2_i1.p1 TRINITY_DN35565_c0_g2~~TRINITY_DN35565_c0_g2_i1.p1  ORF type:complete len:259 (+),score=43.31 TRINITY_DN35565_c0_g2_i1:94-777(+)